MNFEGFKKIKSDKNITILKHPKGHEIKVVHSALKPEMKAKLDKLPIHKMAYGGEATNASSTNDPSDFSDVQSNQPITEEEPIIGSKTQGALNERSAEDAQADEPETSNKPTQQKVRTPSPSAPQTASNPESAPQTASNPDPYGFNEYEQGMKTGYEQQLAGQSAQLAAQGQLGKDIAGIEQKNAQQNQKLSDDYANASAPINEKMNETQNWINENPVNAKNYVDKMSTGAQISTGIGLLLAGLGAGATGGKNVAAEYLQKQVDNDVDAQKANIGNKQSLLNHFRQQGMNEREAYNMARLTNGQILMSQLEAAKGKAQSAEAAGAIQNAQGAIGQQLQQLHHQTTMEKMIYGTTPSGAAAPQDNTEQSSVNRLKTLQQLAPKQYEDMNKKYVPGVGMARTAVDEKGRESLSSLDALDKHLDDAINFATKEGTTAPLTVANQKASDIQNGIQLQVGKLHDLSRINEWEANKYESMVKNPGAFRTDAAVQSFRDLKDEVMIKRNAELNKYGITPFSDSKMQTVEKSQQIPGQKYEQKIINGKSYHVPVGQ
jgi:hypothetical protein